MLPGMARSVTERIDIESQADHRGATGLNPETIGSLGGPAGVAIRHVKLFASCGYCWVYHFKSLSGNTPAATL